MSRNYKIEDLEAKIIEMMYDSSASTEDIGRLALRAIREGKNEKEKQIILTNHIAENKGFPMNGYQIREKQEELGDGGYKRTLFEYSANGQVVAIIFEQNFYAGFGIPNPKGGYVGISS